jgi:hypothetical protein
MSGGDAGTLNYMYLVERDASGDYTLPPQNPSTDVTFSSSDSAIAPGDSFTLTVPGVTSYLSGTYDYAGEVTIGGSPGYIVFSAESQQFYVLTNAQITDGYSLPMGMVSQTSGDMACFLGGTRILTTSGEVCVENLKVGDAVLTHDHQPVSIRWIGRQTISQMFADKLRVLPVRIKAGSLADGVPHRDLLVSPDHAILVDGVLIHAGALVNGTSIIRESNVPSTFTYYHIETDDHSLILAENTPAETFIDNVDRMAFDNWEEYQTIYPEGKPIVELSYPRAKAYRQVPNAVRERLEQRGLTLGNDILSAA